jgi:hypothetical protein
LHLTRVQKEQIEQELITLNREKSDILEQLQHVTRQRNALAEDLLAAKKDIERLSDSNLRLTKEKEDLNKDRNNLIVDVTASERDNRKHAEVCLSTINNCGFVDIFSQKSAKLAIQKKRVLTVKILKIIS